jgi:Na+-transporting NADH:ubiquinone oxidoreductase subunit C
LKRTLKEERQEMSKKGNETIKTITVAGLLCLVCSVIVSSIVVTLRPQQAINAELDMKKNILMSAGMLKDGDDINAVFATLETAIFDMETGQMVSDIDAKVYDQVQATKMPEYMVTIPTDKDVARLGVRSKYAKAYVQRTEAGVIDTLILGHWGKGLWSTMYGFIALGSDLNTIKGFAYFAHGETPGLGGEVGNPKWKAQWIGKKLFNEDGEVIFKVAKAQGVGESQVDGLSGATITAVGVSTSIKYWFGSHGYAKIIATLKAGETQDEN